MNKHISNACTIFFGGLIFAPWLAASVFAAPPASSPLLPNLQALPASDLQLVQDPTGMRLLKFRTITWNAGVGPLILVGRKATGSRQKVYQRVLQANGSYADYLAGFFLWHPQHDHFHFERYAVYTLQSFGAAAQSQRVSAKTTFCVADTDSIDLSLPGAPALPVYNTCSIKVQGISVGWGDTYGSDVAGQWVDFTGLPTGDYTLTITVDPDNRLLETNDGDNVACSKLFIDVEHSTVTEDPVGC